MTDTGVQEIVARARTAQAEYEKMDRKNDMIAQHKPPHGRLWSLPQSAIGRIGGGNNGFGKRS